jgi:hypothetical protein
MYFRVAHPIFPASCSTIQSRSLGPQIVIKLQ